MSSQRTQFVVCRTALCFMSNTRGLPATRTRRTRRSPASSARWPLRCPRNAWALRDRIQFLRLARRFEEAEQAVMAAIELRPDDPDIHAAAAWVASDQDQEDEAVTRVERALAIDPRNATALRDRIQFLRWGRRFEQAEQAATAAIELRPDDPDIHTAAAWVASDQGRQDEAVTRVERALAIDPRNSWALRSRIQFLRLARRFEQAEQAAAQAAELRPDDPDIHTAAAWVASNQDRQDEAVTRVERALAIDPRNATALRSRIQFLRLARRFEQAEQAAAQAAELRPDDPDIHAAAAWVASDQDQEDEAVTRVERALAIDPRNATALRDRIEVLRLARRFEQAEQAATAAIELRPDDPDIHAAAACGAGGLERMTMPSPASSARWPSTPATPGPCAAASSSCGWPAGSNKPSRPRQAIELRPDDPDIHAAAAWVASDQDQEDEAVTRVERALAIDPRNATALRDRIQFLRLARRFEQAEQAATAAIELRPDDPDIHAAAAWVAGDQDQENEAVTRVERALAIDPRNSWALRSRIQFLRLARRFEQAEQAVMAAIELRPDDPDIHTTAAWVASDQGQEDEAVTRVERALAIDPRNATALRSRIEVPAAGPPVRTSRAGRHGSYRAAPRRPRHPHCGRLGRQRPGPAGRGGHPRRARAGHRPPQRHSAAQPGRHRAVGASAGRSRAGRHGSYRAAPRPPRHSYNCRVGRQRPAPAGRGGHPRRARAGHRPPQLLGPAEPYRIPAAGPPVRRSRAGRRPGHRLAAQRS